MSIENIIWTAFSLIMLAQIIGWLVWRICCFFKKTCHWKACPYHQSYFQHPFCMTGHYCKKFPPTPEEIDEHNKKLDDMLKNLLKKDA